MWIIWIQTHAGADTYLTWGPDGKQSRSCGVYRPVVECWDDKATSPTQPVCSKKSVKKGVGFPRLFIIYLHQPLDKQVDASLSLFYFMLLAASWLANQDNALLPFLLKRYLPHSELRPVKGKKVLMKHHQYVKTG